MVSGLNYTRTVYGESITDFNNFKEKMTALEYTFNS